MRGLSRSDERAIPVRRAGDSGARSRLFRSDVRVESFGGKKARSGIRKGEDRPTGSGYRYDCLFHEAPKSFPHSFSVNPHWFQSLVHEWYDPLFRFALSLCSDREQALDLTQNAFYKLAARPDSLHDPSRAKSWLFSVVHREFIDQYRHRTRFPSTHLEVVPETPDPSANPRARTLDREAVLRALQALDETFRAPLSLFYLQSHSYREIATILDIPIGTVMSRLRRGKDRLRALLESGAGATPAETSRADPLDFPQKRTGHE